MNDQKGKVVLVVEDDQALGDIIVQKLIDAGYKAELARDGVAGFTHMKELKPDLVLLDIMMPQKNGYEFLEEKKDDPDVAAIPVLIISNSGEDVEISQTRALGVKDYLVKADFTPEDVLQKVNEQLAGGKAGASALSGSTLLIVEDEPFLKDLLSVKFDKENCKLLHASSGEEALRLVETEKPDVVLLDLVLQGLHGFGVLEQLKANDATKDIPVIILSNLGQESDIKRGMELGAAAFMVKAQSNLNEIIEKVETFVAGGEKG